MNYKQSVNIFKKEEGHLIIHKWSSETSQQQFFYFFDDKSCSNTTRQTHIHFSSFVKEGNEIMQKTKFLATVILINFGSSTKSYQSTNS